MSANRSTPKRVIENRAVVRRVIVTRPARECLHWVEQLQRSGFEAEALPLIEIAPAVNPVDVQALQQAWETLDAYAACLFVSGNAVSYFFKQNRPLAQAKTTWAAIKNIADEFSASLPPQLRFMAPGPGTAAALLAAGVPASQIDGPHGHDASPFAKGCCLAGELARRGRDAVRGEQARRLNALNHLLFRPAAKG